MPIRKLSRCMVLLIVLFTPPCADSLRGQSAPETWSFLAPVAIGNCQRFQGPTALDTPTIGLTNLPGGKRNFAN
jgi:hypothetical protein